MFDIDGMAITMTVGDTGAVKIRATGYELHTDDAALFTIRTASGSILMERVFTNKTGEGIRSDGAIESDNSFTVYFHNGDTENFQAGGTYTWDVRYIINAYRNDSGVIVDGDQVITPYPPQRFALQAPVGIV